MFKIPFYCFSAGNIWDPRGHDQQGDHERPAAVRGGQAVRLRDDHHAGRVHDGGGRGPHGDGEAHFLGDQPVESVGR